MGKRFLLQERVTLTNAQIKALVTTGITLVAAPGTGLVVKFFDAIVRVDATGGAYTNIDAAATIALQLGNQIVSQKISEAVGGAVTALFSNSDTHIAHLKPRSTPTFTLAEGTPNTIANQDSVVPVETKTNIANKALVIKATNGSAGDFTGGNAANTATVDVSYIIV